MFFKLEKPQVINPTSHVCTLEKIAFLFDLAKFLRPEGFSLYSNHSPFFYLALAYYKAL